MEPLEVFILDENFDRMTGSIPYTTLKWTRRYYEPGEFMMEVPADLYLPEWKYVYADDRPETGVIQKVEFVDSDYNADNSVGIDVVKISGFFLEAWLNDFVYLVEEKIEEKYYEEIPHPTFSGLRGYNAANTAPTVDTDADGNVYVVEYHTGGERDENGKMQTYYIKTYYDADTKQFVGAERYAGYNEGKINGTIPDIVDSKKVTPGFGMQGVNNYGNAMVGHTEVNNYKQSFIVEYNTEDGQEKIDIYMPAFFSEDAKPTKSYDVVFSDQSTGKGGGVSIYIDENGEYKYVTGSVSYSREAESYVRKMEQWESRYKGREGVVDHVVSDDGLNIDKAGLWFEKMRTVAGPYVIRDTLDLIGVEKDNVQAVMDYAQRTFGNNILYDTVPIEGEKKIVDPSLQRFGDFAFEELRTVEASIQLTYSFRNGTFVLSIWRGLDRTQSQTNNPWAVFSDTWGTLYSYSASVDESNYRNKCYVLYDYDEPTAWVDKKLAEKSQGQLFEGQPLYKPITETKWGNGYIETTQFIGFRIPYQRQQSYRTIRLDDNVDAEKETYLDLREDKPVCDALWSRDAVLTSEVSGYGALLGTNGEVETIEPLTSDSEDEMWDKFIDGYDYQYTITTGSGDFEKKITYRYFAPRLTEEAAGMKDIYDAYIPSLDEQGTKHLTDNYYVVNNLDTGILDLSGYMKDWNLGDKVDMAVSTLGKYIETRIIEVTETHVSGQSTVEIQLGDQLISEIEKAGLV